jgi:hypothetical protein
VSIFGAGEVGRSFYWGFSCPRKWLERIKKKFDAKTSEIRKEYEKENKRA